MDMENEIKLIDINPNNNKKKETISRMKEAKERQEKINWVILKIYNSKIFRAGCTIVIAASIGTALLSQMKKVSDPATIVAFDMVTNSYGKVLTSDIKEGAQHFDKTEVVKCMLI